jgi:predicted nucleic acid-binding protein
MAWKTVNGRRYYYRSKREGGRVVTEYVGTGEVARLLSQLDTIDRDEREAERQAERAERERFDAEDRAVAVWCKDVEAVARVALGAAGYHRHKRGEWRQRRGRAGGRGAAEDGGRAEGVPSAD